MFVIVRDSEETASGSSVTFQLPASSAAVVFLRPENSTVISADGAAVPQTGTGMSRGITM